MNGQTFYDDRPEARVLPPDQDTAVFENDELPLIPVRGMSVFPGMVFHFDVMREKSYAALEAAMASDQLLLIAAQKNQDEEEPTIEDLYTSGCVIKVKQMLKLAGGAARVLVEVTARAAIDAYVSDDPYFIAVYHPLTSVVSNDEEVTALDHLLRETFMQYMKETRRIPSDFSDALDVIDDLDQLVDVIASNLPLDTETAQAILAETDGKNRLMLTYRAVTKELSRMRIERDLSQKVRTEIDKNQRDYVLREQIQVLQRELNRENGEETTAEGYRKRIAAKDLSDEVREKALHEVARYEKLNSASPEAGVIQDYLDWILALPWREGTEETIDVVKARKILNRDHYALDKVKERILEYISVLSLTDSMKAPILCLVGPPGVGKTSIAKSIADALNRPYVRMSLGGLNDEAEIRGHRRTYIGAIPGRIISHIRQVGANNPLFLLDEIDKISQNFRGDPSAALLEVLDPEQNSTFTDNYLELPFDLSHVLFLTTANSLQTIPRPLLDRMEIIEVDGYVDSEKQEIAKRYLVPKQREAHGLTAQQLTFSKGAIRDIVDYYTRESGVRELEREIAKVCRVAAREIVEDGAGKRAVTARNLTKYLGRHQYEFDHVEKGAVVGLVNGLAWTAVGGVTLEIEAVVVDGKGKTVVTGKLGDVMKESIQAAIGFIRSRADKLGIDPSFYEEKDIHLHVPEGAVPKDGPSAGITMATALISALTGKPVSQDLAMTGEITLLGRVLPIGGLREKLTAAHRAGIKRVLIPKKNVKDLEDVPDAVTEALDIHPVETMDEVIDFVFEGAE